MTPRNEERLMGRMAAPAACLMVVVMLLALAVGTGGGALPPPPLAAGVDGAPAALNEAVDRNADHGDGLTLVIVYGLTDRMVMQSSTSVAWHPGLGGRGAFLLETEGMEARFHLGLRGLRGLPWAPYMAIRLNGRTSPVPFLDADPAPAPPA